MVYSVTAVLRQIDETNAAKSDHSPTKWKMGDPRFPDTSKLNVYRNKSGAIVNSYWVQGFVTFMIIVNALLMGVQVGCCKCPVL
jgi:hypothetical protein